LILKPFNEIEIAKQVGLLLRLKPRSSNHEKDIQKFPDLKMEDYDLTDLLKFCMGDNEMLVETLQEIVCTTKEDLLGIESALGSLDFEKILESVHRLSSRLAQMKIKSATLAMEIERDLKIGKSSSTDNSISKLVYETNQVMDKIQSDWLLESAK